MASTAVPGFYPPVALAAKNDEGKRQAYLPSRKWVDGSISDDLPAKRLTRLYGVNHFIVSQTNPHVFPFVMDAKRKTGIISTLEHASRKTAREWINAGVSLVEKPLSWNPTINRLTNMALAVINQDYIGDINILPSKRFFNPLKLLAHRSVEEIIELIEMGERATWPKIEMIRIQTKISRRLDKILTGFDRDLSRLRRDVKRRAS
jgi:NTE family protein